MKNTIKWFGIIVLVMVIGFSMAACDFGGSNDSNGNGNGDNGGSGGDGTNPTITIRNNTGYYIHFGILNHLIQLIGVLRIGSGYRMGNQKRQLFLNHCPLIVYMIFD